MAHLLTPEQAAEFRDAFSVFDDDGSGSIDASELVKVLKSMGQNLTNTEIEHMVKEVDAGGDGIIQLEEFLEMMGNKLQYKENEDEIMDAFKVFDNGKGFIKEQDFRDIMVTLGDRMTHEEVDEMIIEANPRRGLINIADFVSILCR